MTYNTIYIAVTDQTFVVQVHTAHGNRTLRIPIPSDAGQLGYSKPSRMLVIDTDGLFTEYLPRKWKPFCPLPPVFRECSQFEYDRYCSENPTDDGKFDWNAAVYNAARAH
jgi:hypothetical protein